MTTTATQAPSPRPIEQARDADLRLSPSALRRAAQRARELAARTGTALIVQRDGQLVHIEPAARAAERHVAHDAGAAGAASDEDNA